MSQLRNAGLTRTQIDTMRRRGDLIVKSRGVYLARGAPLTYEALLWIASLATDGVFGFGTACHLWGLLPEPPSPMTVLVPESRRLTPPSHVQLRRRVRTLATTKRAGFAVTTRGESAIDYLTTLTGDAAMSFFDRAVQQKWLTAKDLERRLAVPTQGNSELRKWAALVNDGAASRFERDFHRLLKVAGITSWQANYRVRVAGRTIAVIDIAFVAQRLAIELDGFAFHSNRAAFQRDRDRQNALIALGWRVLRFTWDDLMSRPREVVLRIRAQLSA